ncbi:MAG: acetyltransferase [Calditrichaeota bacterium]|nr:MAG: acetyltransferase [Calditrichota bacterium]
MLQRLARAVQQICVETALRAYEEAKMSGLCQEGAWELAVDAMRTVNLDEIVRRVIGEAAEGLPG